jgi:hypothetical protein
MSTRAIRLEEGNHSSTKQQDSTGDWLLDQSVPSHHTAVHQRSPAPSSFSSLLPSPACPLQFASAVAAGRELCHPASLSLSPEVLSLSRTRNPHAVASIPFVFIDRRCRPKLFVQIPKLPSDSFLYVQPNYFRFPTHACGASYVQLNYFRFPTHACGAPSFTRPN